VGRSVAVANREWFDGNVFEEGQCGAAVELLKFFKLVLKRDMGRIEAIRASKGTFVPTVLSTEEVSQVFDRLEVVVRQDQEFGFAVVDEATSSRD